MKTNKLLNILIISNLFTALCAIGAFYFSYSAASDAEDAYYEAANAAVSAAATNSTISYGVNCINR